MVHSFSNGQTTTWSVRQGDGSYSPWEMVKSGIPQGTVLGPTLFLIYINDLPQAISNECALFADDTTAYAIPRKTNAICANLSSDLNAAAHWANVWGMLFKYREERASCV